MSRLYLRRFVWLLFLPFMLYMTVVVAIAVFPITAVPSFLKGEKPDWSTARWLSDFMLPWPPQASDREAAA